MAENLEQKTESEFGQLFKGIANTFIGAGAIGASYALLGTTGLAIASAAPLSGRIVTKLAGNDYTGRNFRNDTLAGAVTAPLFVGILNAVTRLPRYYGIDGLVNILGASIPAYSLGVAGFTLAAIPFFTALTYPIGYMVRNKTLKGIGKDFSENYWKSTKKTMLYLGLPGAALVSLGATLPYLAPYLAPIYFGLGIVSRAMNSKEKLDYKKLFNPSTYLPNFLNPFYIVEGLASLISRAVRSSPKPAAPELSPQPAH
ncbi:hypothetical protein HYX06_05565 [Candidatus Woesearchaeota archaeon]|nr:hypothetical protein [Candidatus Woesearchaeota archaeon]